MLYENFEFKLCKLSKNKESFDSVKGTHRNALENSSFTHKLEYKEPPNTRNRRRKCIDYNPLLLPVSTNENWKFVPKSTGQTL